MMRATQAIDLQDIMENALINTSPDYVDLQRSQLFSGVDSEANPIHRIGAPYPGYAPTTIAIKQRKGQPTDRVTLKDTGQFYSEIFTDPRAEGIIVDSADGKSGKLQEAYGEEIFGLDQDNKERYIERLRPAALEELEKQLNG